MTAPQPPDLARFYDHALRQLDAEDAWDDSKLHPSDLGATIPGEGCLRKIYLRLRGAQGNPETVGKRLMFETAKAFHIFLQDLLGRFFDAWDANGDWRLLRVEGEAHVEGLGSGRLDVLLEHVPTKTLCVVDFKTQSGRGFIFLRKAGAAKPAHILQVRHYMMADDSEMGIVVYVDREGSGGFWVSPPFGRDDNAVRTAWEAMKSATTTLPPPPPPGTVMVEEAGGKVAKPALPWFCRYHNSLGEVEECPYLDTSHCPGALPAEQRQADIFVWKKIKIPAKKGGK